MYRQRENERENERERERERERAGQPYVSASTMTELSMMSGRIPLTYLHK